MIYIRNIILIIVLYFVLPSCSFIQDVELVDIGEVDSVRFVDNNLILSLSPIVYNPNFFNLKLKGIEFDILKDTLTIGKGHLNQDILLGKHDTVKLSPEININFSMLPLDVFSQDYHTIKVVGFANVTAPINKFYFSLYETINVSDYVDLLVSDLFQEEDFEVQKISVNTIGLNDIIVDGVFQISNTNNLTYSIEKTNVEFYATSKYKNKLGDSEVKSTFFIEPDSLNVFDFTVKLKTIDTGSFLLSKLFNQNNKIYMKLNVIVKYQNITFPFSIYKELSY